MKLPDPNKPIDNPLTIDECLNLMEKETADFERQLKKRQLRIIMKLAQKVTECDSDKITRKIANSAIDIINTRLHGVESISGDWHHIEHQLYFELLKEITSESNTE
ncbi:hypothetical protein Ga0466249_005020 [Sporomusaceae bacterium BoRhaA]|uniref:hypothetical protein n=1 Tax=Pelorhabdus rhamnosifermentans TaxID=2772457 RepID=UPI001C0622EC|nr:hypothetical protein [Pelorhabdus rhamnosifermentans]MBU2703870.1 hypothetical protein [Pelorhabdus rhamnosifermentans]